MLTPLSDAYRHREKSLAEIASDYLWHTVAHRALEDLKLRGLPPIGDVGQPVDARKKDYRVDWPL